MSWEQYETAQVRLHLPEGLVIVAPEPAGATEGPFPRSLGGPIVVITAHNPMGKTVSESENSRAHRDLLARLDAEGVQHFPGCWR